MKIDLLLLLFVVVGWVGAASVGSRIASPRTPSPTPDPLWNPIDPRQFPPAKPTVKAKKKKKKTKSKPFAMSQDTVHIQYVVAPLLKAEVGPIFGVCVAANALFPTTFCFAEFLNNPLRSTLICFMVVLRLLWSSKISLGLSIMIRSI
jgi:hypothetical protein